MPTRKGSSGAGKAAAGLVYAFLRDGSSREMNVNGSVTPVDFEYIPASEALIYRMNWMISDANMGFDNFGGLAALTNGLSIKVFDTDGTTELLDFTDGENIKSNADFTYLAGTDSIVEPAAGDDWMPIRWTIEKAGAPLRLGANQVLRVSVNDNLTGLSLLRAMVQGVIR